MSQQALDGQARDLTVNEIARRLRVSALTVRRMIKRDDLPARRLRGQYRIPLREFEAWYEARDVKYD